jgi:threonine aldolase
MKRAMAQAEVGDDVYGEDPTARALEQRIAALLGKEAALFVPSGTMGNQLAILSQTERADEVYAGQGSHCIWYESGAGAAWSGVQLVEVGSGGLFTAAELEAAIKPQAYYMPRPRLVVVENTHNRGGGKVFPQDEATRIAALARREGLAVHLDGARLWNAAAATGASLEELAAPFDTVSVCFSKGLGAPIGSALAGPSAVVRRAHRFRKMLGGGMRQVGMLAAACLHAIEHHRGRLIEDHDNARRFARVVADAPGVSVEAPQTNIVMVDLDVDAANVVARLAEKDVLAAPFATRRIRVVTHLDVTAQQVEEAARAFVAVLRETPRP